MNKTEVINIIKKKLQSLLNFYTTKKYKEVINKGLPILKKNPELNFLTNEPPIPPVAPVIKIFLFLKFII